MNFPPSLQSIKRLPCLDGWRFLSIVFVLLWHSKKTDGYPSFFIKSLRWLPDGDFGVEFFFLISGFLITYLLLKEKDRSSTIHLRQFYLRRAYRILPAYGAYLIVLCILVSWTSLRISTASWIGLITYTVNFINTPWIGAHIWSLSVEEQFYLIWPFLFWLFLAKNNSIRASFIVLFLPIIIAPICRTAAFIYHNPFPIGYFSFFNRCDSLAVGCLLAFLMAFRGRQLESFIKKYPKILLLSAFLLIVVPLILTRMFLLGILTVPFATTSYAFGIALLIVLSILLPNLIFFRWLEWKPIAGLGVMSYSIYLWQQIFCTNPSDFGLSYAPWFLSFPYWLIPVFLVAFISYQLIEKPFLRVKSRLSS